jgi:general secretion pathway protein K
MKTFSAKITAQIASAATSGKFKRQLFAARAATLLAGARARIPSFSQPRRVRTQRAGFIIVAVLWIIGALATLAVIYSLYVRQTALSFVDHDEQLQAQAMAMSGIELAAYQLTKAGKAANAGNAANTANAANAANMANATNAAKTPAVANAPPPLQGQFTFNQGTATIRVRFVSENSRIDLNFAPKQLLAGLLGSFGVANDEALNDADDIIGWRSPIKAGQSDPGAAVYQASGKAYGPRHGPFQHPEELALVADLRPTLVDRILPYVTVYSGRPEVNVLIAPPQVLEAVPGMSAEVLQQLLNTRQSDPRDVLRAQLGAASQYLTIDAAAAYRVTVAEQFPTGARFRSQAVILLANAGGAPYRVLSWQDDVPSAARRAAAVNQ